MKIGLKHLSILFFLFISICVQAQNKYQKLIQEKFGSHKNDTNKVKEIIDFASSEFKTANLTDSDVIYLLTPAIEIAKKVKYTKGIINADLRAALISRTVGNYTLCHKYLDDAEAYAVSTKDSVNLFNVYSGRGNVFWLQGYFNEAAQVKFKSLKVAELLRDDRKISTAYNGIGNLYIEQKNAEKAILYHLKALEIRIKLVDTLIISHSYVNLGVAYLVKKDFDSSVYFFSKALKLQIIKGNKTGQAYSYDGIGNGKLEQKKFDEALGYYKRAQKLLAKSDDINEIVINYSGLATCYLKSNKLDSAFKYIKLTRKISLEINKLPSLKDAYSLLTEYYETIKYFDSALIYNKKYNQIKDSLYGSESAKKVAALEFLRQQEQEQKLKEIENFKLKAENDAKLNKQKWIIYSLSFVFIIVIAFSLYVYKNMRQKAEAHRIISLQKKEVEQKNELIEEKQKEILDSIHYAKRIQTTLLAHKDFIDSNLKENFVLFKPKDIVSGDFYWATKREHLFYLAVCDSTGHGVPGAFMSLLSISFLSEAINEKQISKPNEVFNYVRKKLIENISRDGQQDGFDGILICLDSKENKLTYAAANNAPLLISNGVYKELESDRMPVGKGIKSDNFKEYEINYTQNDSLYLYTDGYADQFGGPKGKKFMYKRLNDLLARLSNCDLQSQKNELSQTIEEWKGGLEQVDDVCLIGIRLI